MKRMFSVLGKITFIVALTLFIACGEDEPGPPKIIGCDDFTYDGYIYRNCGCKKEINSFDYTCSDDDLKYTFHIECNWINGCITSVKVIKKNKIIKSITAPNQ